MLCSCFMLQLLSVRNNIRHSHCLTDSVAHSLISLVYKHPDTRAHIHLHTLTLTYKQLFMHSHIYMLFHLYQSTPVQSFSPNSVLFGDQWHCVCKLNSFGVWLPPPCFLRFSIRSLPVGIVEHNPWLVLCMLACSI